MDAIRGFVYRTIYENTQRTYCVFVLKDYNEEYITCTGRGKCYGCTKAYESTLI